MNRKYADIILSRILSLCELRGITINKLADMSGIRQSTLHNLVCGASVNPTMRTMHKIAIAFNMTLAEFLDFPDLNNYSFDDDEEERCLRIFRAADGKLKQSGMDKQYEQK